MSTPQGAKNPLRCHYCGREVSETMHTRSSYRVDYYGLHTGDVEPATISRRDDPTEVVTVLRLIRPAEVWTCADCYRQPHVRRNREVLFRPELIAPTAQEGPA